jgi:hypothetical protein
MALGSDGNMWFAEGIGANAIGRITPTGVVTSFAPITAVGYPPATIAASPNGNLWFSQWGHETLGKSVQQELEEGRSGFRIGRFRIPLTPVNNGLPAITGEAIEGQVLSASEGTWSNEPSGFEYQWELCDALGGSCASLSGEVGVTHALTAGDVGHTLRVVVSANGAGGSASAVSDSSGVVQAAPPAPPPVKPAEVSVRLPVVRARMTWNFGWTRAYTIIESLVVHGLPVGGGVEVACDGRGCAFAHHHWATAARNRACRRRRCALGRPVVLRGSANLTGLFKGRHLQVGARVVVTVEKAGWIGKSFVFTMRANRPPRVQITCRGSGASDPAGVC